MPKKAIPEVFRSFTFNSEVIIVSYMEQNETLSLRQIREDFGWTQQDLAHRIGVSLSTLIRWEKRRTKEPFISAVTRKTNRRLHYLLAMVDPDVIRRVEEADSYMTLHHGEDLLAVACSKKYIAHYPALAMVLGFPTAPLIMGTARRQYFDNMDTIRKGLRLPGSAGYWVTEDAGVPSVMGRGKAMTLQVIAPSLVLVDGRDTVPADMPSRIEFTILEA